MELEGEEEKDVAGREKCSKKFPIRMGYFLQRRAKSDRRIYLFAVQFPRDKSINRIGRSLAPSIAQ